MDESGLNWASTASTWEREVCHLPFFFTALCINNLYFVFVHWNQDYLGEQALLTSAKRNASAFSESHCELLVLRRTLFIELCTYYTDLPIHVLKRSPMYCNSKPKAQLVMEMNVAEAFGIDM